MSKENTNKEINIGDWNVISDGGAIPEPMSFQEEDISEDTVEEDVIVGEEDTQEDSVEDVSLEDVTDTPAPPEDKPKPETSENKPNKKESRAQARIRKLANERRELEEQYIQEQKKAKELEAKLKEYQKATNSSTKSKTEATLQILNKQLVQALEDGDSETVVDIQDKIVSAKMELAALTAQEHEYNQEPSKDEVDVEKTQQRPELSEETRNWIDEHPRFNTDREFNAMALIINNNLLQEGFDPEHGEFFEELDSRLSKYFPDEYEDTEFGGQEKDVVPSNQSIKQNVDGDVEETDEPQNENRDSTSNASEYRQHVSGSSRQSPTKVTKVATKKSSQKKISPVAAELADRWGISLKNMAHRIEQSNSKKDGGDNSWTEIL